MILTFVGTRKFVLEIFGFIFGKEMVNFFYLYLGAHSRETYTGNGVANAVRAVGFTEPS
jgi:hypothetical protein